MKILVAAISLSCVAMCFAQVDTVVITGRVYDQTKAVVPKAAVSIVNTATNYRIEANTNADGVYTSPPLPPGRYRVEARATGFQPVAKVFQVNLGEAPSVDFVLPPASVSSSVSVEGVAPVINSQTTTLSTSLTVNQLQSLPINERNFAEFLRYAPGSVPGQANKQNLALSQERGNVSNAVNGAQFSDNNFLVDGLQDNSNHQGWGLINYPELEAIDQFTVETSVPDARFGRSGGWWPILRSSLIPTSSICRSGMPRSSANFPAPSS